MPLKFCGESLILFADHDLGAELQRVFAGGENGTVIDLKVELAQVLWSDVRPAAGESSGDLNLWSDGVGSVGVAVPAEAYTSFVHEMCGGCGDVTEAEGMFVRQAVVAGLGERCRLAAGNSRSTTTSAASGTEPVR